MASVSAAALDYSKYNELIRNSVNAMNKQDEVFQESYLVLSDTHKHLGIALKILPSIDVVGWQGIYKGELVRINIDDALIRKIREKLAEYDFLLHPECTKKKSNTKAKDLTRIFDNTLSPVLDVESQHEKIINLDADELVNTVKEIGNIAKEIDVKTDELNEKIEKLEEKIEKLPYEYEKTRLPSAVKKLKDIARNPADRAGELSNASKKLAAESSLIFRNYIVQKFKKIIITAEKIIQNLPLTMHMMEDVKKEIDAHIDAFIAERMSYIHAYIAERMSQIDYLTDSDINDAVEKITQLKKDIHTLKETNERLAQRLGPTKSEVHSYLSFSKEILELAHSTAYAYKQA